MNFHQLNVSKTLSTFRPVAIGLVLLLILLLTITVYAQQPHTGYVVVVFPGEDTVVRSVEFITDTELVPALRLAGFDVESLNDTTICSVDGVGCPATDCFCSQNWWASAKWDETGLFWDAFSWPPAPLQNDGEALGFRWSDTNWGPPALPAPQLKAAADGYNWLLSQQITDTGAFPLTSNFGHSLEAMMALGANRYYPATVRVLPDSPSLQDYVMNYDLAGYATYAGAAGKLAAAIASGPGALPSGVLAPSAFYSDTTGAYSDAAVHQAWAILGTLALNQPVPPLAVQHLAAVIQSNGGWEWSPGWGTDTNSTALAVQALIAAGEPLDSSAVISGLQYLMNAQNPDGGFPYNPDSQWGTDSDANSTAYVVQALYAARQAPDAGSAVLPGGSGSFGSFVFTDNSAIDYLMGLQTETGQFEFQSGVPGVDFVGPTRQTVLALLGKPFPVKIAHIKHIFLPIVLK